MFNIFGIISKGTHNINFIYFIYLFITVLNPTKFTHIIAKRSKKLRITFFGVQNFIFENENRNMKIVSLHTFPAINLQKLPRMKSTYN